MAETTRHADPITWLEPAPRLAVTARRATIRLEGRGDCPFALGERITFTGPVLGSGACRITRINVRDGAWEARLEWEPPLEIAPTE